MSNLRKAPFFGGPLDGQQMYVSDEIGQWPPYIRFPVADTSLSRGEFASRTPAAVDTVDVKEVVYVLHRLRGSTKTFHAYAPEDWDGDRLMSRLLHGAGL